MDIPGRGDTCYPSVLPDGPDRYLVCNYTSPLDGPDLPWLAALVVGPTVTYRTTLTFANNERTAARTVKGWLERGEVHAQTH